MFMFRVRVRLYFEFKFSQFSASAVVNAWLRRAAIRRVFYLLNSLFPSPNIRRKLLQTAKIEVPFSRPPCLFESTGNPVSEV